MSSDASSVVPREAAPEKTWRGAVTARYELTQAVVRASLDDDDSQTEEYL